jgi:hypothetical protein
VFYLENSQYFKQTKHWAQRPISLAQQQEGQRKQQRQQQWQELKQQEARQERLLELRGQHYPGLLVLALVMGHHNLLFLDGQLLLLT